MESKLEQIRKNIEAPLKKENITVDSIEYGKDHGEKTLFIVVDAPVVDLNMCVKATEIINPIIDELDLIDEEYTLDVSGKVKGNKDEC